MGEILNVLVLGVGGTVSRGILKALALSGLPVRVVGACISPLSLGLYTVDRAYVSPRAVDPAFLDWVLATCRTERIHAILSGVEPVLTVLSNHAQRIRDETGALCVVSEPDCLAIGDDKLLTCRWLERQGLNFPGYAASDDAAGLDRLVREHGYPLIGKPRTGKGGHGVIEIRNASDLGYAASLKDYIVQEHLGSPDSEYTVGCVSDRDGVLRGTIAMRRELLQGTTFRAEVGEFPEVRAEARRIATALRPMGPSNIQLRVSNGRPVCFEINVRFSGTTPIRARLGFNDVAATLRHFVLGEPMPDLPLVTQGIALRYWNEMYIDPQAYATLRETGKLDAPHEFDLQVETYGISK